MKSRCGSKIQPSSRLHAPWAYPTPSPSLRTPKPLAPRIDADQACPLWARTNLSRHELSISIQVKIHSLLTFLLALAYSPQVAQGADYISIVLPICSSGGIGHAVGIRDRHRARGILYIHKLAAVAPGYTFCVRYVCVSRAIITPCYAGAVSGSVRATPPLPSIMSAEAEALASARTAAAIIATRKPATNDSATACLTSAAA